MGLLEKSGKISVTNQLAFGFAAVIALLLLISGAALYSQNQSTIAVDKLILKDVKLAELSLKSNNALLKARRHEKDFYLNERDLGFHQEKSHHVAFFSRPAGGRQGQPAGDSCTHATGRDCQNHS